VLLICCFKRLQVLVVCTAEHAKECGYEVCSVTCHVAVSPPHHGIILLLEAAWL
jgi:hypothetical protein